jgi:hypothetical protein
MKRKIYKLSSSAKQGLFALALVVSGSAHSQLSYTITYTGAVQTLTLPAGNWGIACWGGDGGDITTLGGGGKGGYSYGAYNVVTPGTLLNILVGGKGGSVNGTNGPSGSGGWNGGGGGGYCGKSAGGGGGATDVRVSGIAAANRVIVAGGGGGAAYYNALAVGGHGGAVIAQNGDIITSGNVTTPGGGGAGANGSSPGLTPNGFLSTSGTATGGGGGGNSPTGFGQQGTGGGAGGAGGSTAGGSTGGSGGGGGGYAGGAGGTQTVNVGAAGGGGSSYIGGVTSGTTMMFGTPGFTTNPDVTGNGRVIITELCNITMVGSTSNSLNPSICSGQSLTITTNAISNYSWSTGATTSSLVVSPTTSTVYALTATSPSNCTTSRTISVTVSSGLPVLSISNPSNNICLGRTVSLTATGAITYTWANAGVVNGQSFTPTSTTVYTVTGENGCGITTATTNIIVTPLVVTALTSPTLVCEGYPATLTAVSAVNGYTWWPVANTGSLITVAPMANTIYTVVASDGTCSGTSTVALQTKTTPTITASASATQICQGQSSNLNASGAGNGGTYSWSPGGGTGSSISVSPATSTMYVVMGTNSLNCSAQAQQIVLVDPQPVINIVATQTLVCAGNTINLTATGGTNYVWTNGPSSPLYVITANGPAVYTVTAQHTSNSCFATKTISVSAVISAVTVSSNTAVCTGGSATLTASGATSYTWNGIPGSGPAYVASPANTTTYNLVANTQSLSVNCFSSYSVVVTVNPNPTITAAAIKSLTCKGQANTLTATGANTYIWVLASSGSSVGTGASVVVNPNITTLYYVTAIDNNGCEGTSQIQAKVSTCPGMKENSLDEGWFVYPNPNNGTFVLRSYVEMELVLVNEMGQQLRSISLNDSNGLTTEVKDLKPGIYFILDKKGQNTSAQKIVVN